MSRFPRRRGALAALLLAALIPAAAQAQDPREELTRAEDYFLVGDTTTALEKATRLLDAGALTGDARFSAWILRGRCETAHGKDGPARDAFCEALRLDPRWQPDAALFTAAEVASVDRARAAGCGDPAFAGVQPGTTPAPERTAAPSYLPPPAAGGGGTPWYRKKMVLGLVGAAAAAAVLAFSGGGDDAGGAVELPGFPELPAR